MPTIQEKVTEKIASSGEKVAELVINKLADIEIQKRTNSLMTAVSKIDSLQKELKKTSRPDISYDSTGTKIESFSEKKHQDIQKFKKNISSLETAVKKCLEENSYESYKKLQELTGGGPKEGKSDGESSEDSSESDKSSN